MPQKSRISDATWTAFTEAIRFVIVPLVLVNLVTTNYPELKTPFMPDLRNYILFFGGMIVAASTLECANKPGTYKRLLFGLSALAFICLWLFVIFGGGIAQFSYGPYVVRFDMSKIVYIMLVGLSLKGLLVINTFSTNKPLIVEQERRQRQEEMVAPTTALPAPRRRPKPSGPELSAFSKMAFDVTPDDSVGYTSQPPTDPSLAYKQCPVCGAKASPNETTCKNCGAWFSSPFK